MKIVHISDCFLPRLGGIEIQVAELTRLQKEHGHRVSVITATPNRSRTAPDHPADVRRIIAPLPWELPVHPRAGHELRGALEELRPDVVHIHIGVVSPFAWSGVRESVRLGLPTVVTVHSLWDPVTQGIYRTLDRLVGWRGWPMVGTTVSTAAAAPIRAVAGGGVDVGVVGNGIDPAGWRLSSRGTAGAGAGSGAGAAGAGAAGDDVVHVVAVGRLAPRKRPIALLRVLGAAHRRLPPAVQLRATIVGDGPARPAMERHILRNGLGSWVRLAGRLDRSEIQRVLGTADVFVAPAIKESFGIAALEARTAGVPIVAYTRSGISDFVSSGVEGLLADTEPGMVDAIVRLAGDAQLRHRIAAYNRATEPTDCSWPATLKGFDEQYHAARERVGLLPVD
ncbi:glycosyltransferase family 4 protein [Flindersiella endophytica]